MHLYFARDSHLPVSENRKKTKNVILYIVATLKYYIYFIARGTIALVGQIEAEKIVGIKMAPDKFELHIDATTRYYWTEGGPWCYLVLPGTRVPSEVHGTWYPGTRTSLPAVLDIIFVRHLCTASVEMWYPGTCCMCRMYALLGESARNRFADKRRNEKTRKENAHST